VTRLSELRRMLAEATPGPWRQNPYGVIWIDEPTIRRAGGRWLARAQIASVTGIPDDLPDTHVSDNAALIVALRNAAPALLDVVEAARELQYVSSAAGRALHAALARLEREDDDAR
jgi:hypothetical protein